MLRCELLKIDNYYLRPISSEMMVKRILSLWYAKFDVGTLAFGLIIVFLLSTSSISQIDYNMKLSNGIRVNENTIDFDVTVKALNNNFVLTSYQCAFVFNPQITNGGELTFTYLEGSSQIANLPSYAVGINNIDGELKLTFASMAGSDSITSNESIIGRFRLQNTASFANIDLNLKWDFNGFVATIITGQYFQNITTPANHKSITNIALGTELNNSIQPADFKLLQNFPNPFNPNTTLAFNLPVDGQTKLEVYNALGQKVEEIINDYFQAGNHNVEFRGNGLPSGTYFCRLDVKNKYSETIKMVLLK